MKWQSSGITDDLAVALELADLDGGLTRAMSANLHPVRSLFIPYHDKAGVRTTFYRVRYLEALPGWAGMAEKPQRYAQPAGTLNRAYFPRVPGVDWQKIASDASVDLYLTEGELKSAAATARGFPTVGLGGVDVWRAQRRGLGLLPDLEDVVWNVRRVRVVFDSDAHQNVNVVRAQLQLASALTQAGAAVMFVNLPPGADNAKQGFDDYLLAHTDEEFRALVATASPYDEGRALAALNAEVVLVRDPVVIYERASGNLVNRDNFVRTLYADRKYIESTMRGNPPAPVNKEKPLAERWLAWSGRAQVTALTYRPGHPEYVDGKLNLWKGWGVAPCAGSIDLWSRLLDHLFCGAEAGAREWFERWCAYPLQHPGEKMYTAACIWGAARGTGKTLAAYTLKRLYGENALEIRSEHLHGAFNEWARNRQLIIGDEITGSDRRADADRLKGLVTQHQVTINSKYVPAYVLPDCINYLFTSNHPDALFVDEGERRYFIHEVTVDPLPQAFYTEYDAWYKSSDVGALFSHLLALDLGDFNPCARAFKTSSAVRMVEETRSELAQWCRDLLGGGVLERAGAAGASDLYAPKQLLELYKMQTDNGRSVTPAVMGRELHRLRLEQRVIRVGGSTPRLYAVRRRDEWAAKDSREWAEHFAQHAPDPRIRY